MSTQHPTAPAKPNKPSDSFPLFAHATGRWAKKIKGKMHYFGPWDDPDGALKSYLDQKDDLHADHQPRQAQGVNQVSGVAAGEPDKPSKPYPEFPLFAHATKRWAKKIRGQLHYIGPWDNPDPALKKYLEEKDDLHAGRKPRQASTGVTVKELVNAFLEHKEAKVEAGELSPRTWTCYKETTDLLIARLGKTRLVVDLRPEDFETLKKTMTKKWAPVRVRNYIQYTRSVFRYGLEAELLSTPVRFGPGFARPSKKTLRLDRAKKGLRMFEAHEIRQMLDVKKVENGQGYDIKPTTSLRAMILLGINCGYGNADCGTLPLSALELERGWISYHRPKTGITRRAALWPETVEALKAVFAERRKPAKVKYAGLVFITSQGLSWHKDANDSPVSKEMRKHLDALGINGHRSFYALRHTFETIGGEFKDQVAVHYIMGHARDDMASVYRERISDERLKAVSD
jgi:integrase